MTKRGDQFQTIRTEGALLPPDILQSVASLKVDGVSPAAYHLPPGTKLNEAIAHSWSVLQKYWKGFQEARSRLDPEKTGTELTNQHWLLPLFEELKYGRLTTGKAPEIDGRTYPIERFYAQQPIHLIGCNLPLDRRTTGARGAATSSPYSMMQEYLNRSPDSVWGFLSNGLQLRLLRDNISLSRQAYVEFNLEAMMEGEVYADFALLWMLCHQSRIEADKPTDFWLEQWSHLARDLGTRVLADLRLGVTNAIAALGKGFLAHPRNDRLREKLQSGQLDTQEYYRQLLRIVYRLLFLFVAEDRKLLHPPSADVAACELYDTYYSTRRLRDLADSIRGSKHADLWHSFSLVCQRLNQPYGCAELGLIGLGSFLWNPANTVDLLGPHQAASDNDAVLIKNDDLLTAVRALAYVEQDKVRRAVDYRNLGSEELGSVYESLLELHPILNVHARTFDLSVAAGNERKTTGSYYTPDSLVQCLLDSALDPVVQDRLQGKRGAEAEAAILNIKVCDPACGSGHFLIAAAHRLARHLGRIRTGESEPSPEDHQHALRDVIGRCIYGVDINPMAVELCKVSLWMEAIEPGRPLGFLDHHIQCGNSLLGTTPALLKKGIPDDAFTPIEGDDKKIAQELKRDNKKERREHESQQGYLFDPPYKLGNMPSAFAELAAATDNNWNDVLAKEQQYAQLVQGTSYLNARFLADTWCAAFFWKKDNSDLGKLCPTERLFRRIENSPHDVLPFVREEVRRLASQYQILHWHLAFPDVFRVIGQTVSSPSNEQTGWDGGFDVVLGNPPWEKLQTEELQFFAAKAPDIAAMTGSKRKEAIKSLQSTDPQLAKEWLAQKRFDAATISFVRDSQYYPQTGVGKFNTYALFAELNRTIVSPTGRVGCIVPTGIATDDTTKHFFRSITETQSLISLFDFENRRKLFPEVDSRMKFCLLTIAGLHSKVQTARYVFFAYDAQDVADTQRLFTLSAEDIRSLNPNTRTCPIFRGAKDAEITKYVYRNTPVFLVEGHQEGSPYTPNVWRLLNTTDDSSLFYSLRDARDRLRHPIPVLEAKTIHQFDHRYASYDESGEELHELTSKERHDPNSISIARFNIEEEFFCGRLPDELRDRQWFLTARNITNATNERTVIAAVIPRAASCEVTPYIETDGHAATTAFLVGVLNSFALDYVARQKLGGTHLSYFILYQLPVVWCDPQADIGTLVVARVLELCYTCWDLEAFALDCGYAGPPFRWDEERRFLLRCELDATYFHLYLGTTERWAADNSQLLEMFPTPRAAVDYILDTFPIVRRKDEQAHGEYRTKRVILEIYDAMAEAIRTGQPYQTRLNPPPGPPTDAAGNFIPMAQWDPNHWPSHIHPPRTAPAPQRVAAVIEPAFPRIPLDKVLCACLLEAVQLQPGLTEDQYVDFIVLSMQPARCRLLLTGDDRKKFDRAVKSTPPELIADADAHPLWSSLLKCLLANQSLSRSERALVAGSNFAAVRATLPAIDNQFAALVAKAAERLRELQEAAAPDVATVTVVEELKVQHAAAMAETRG